MLFAPALGVAVAGALSAPIAVPLILGDSCGEAVSVVQVLVGAGVVLAVDFLLTMMIIVRGTVRIFASLRLLQFALYWPIFWAFSDNATMAAAAFTLLSLAFLVAQGVVVFRSGSMRRRDSRLALEP